MRVRLLHKVRKAAWRILAYKGYGYTLSNGIVTGLRYCHGYGWAFDWMIGRRLNFDNDSDQQIVVFTVARLLWAKELRDKWAKKLGRTTAQKGGEK